MTFTIGGIDLIMQGPRTSAPWRIILEMGHELWPNCVYEDANEDETQPLIEVLSARKQPQSPEFFLYKDQANADSWTEHGMTPANNRNKIHFLLDDDPE